MSLGISNVSDSHYGNYSCVLNTSLGMSSERILLVKMKRETGSYLYFVILTYFFFLPMGGMFGDSRLQPAYSYLNL